VRSVGIHRRIAFTGQPARTAANWARIMITYRLGALLLASVVAGCRADERHASPSVAASTSVSPDAANGSDSGVLPDSSVLRTVAHIDSLPHNGQPGDARSLVTFTDSSTLEIPVRDAELLGQLPLVGQASWLLIAGTECSQCDANVTVWLFRGVPGRVAKLQPGFPYPGSMTEAGNATTPYFRSRLFVGACLDTADEVAVWSEELLKPDSARTRRIRVLASSPTLAHRELPWSAEAERRLIARVSAGRCREVPPLDQFVA